MRLIATAFRYIGRFFFRASKRLETFADCPHFTVGSVYFFFHAAIGFGILRDEGYSSFFFGPIEIMVMS